MTLRLLYHLPLRQAEGFLHALFGIMRLDLSVPDYTTLSRRSQHLKRRLRPVPPGKGLHLVLDSTGMSIVGAGEWAAAKHGGCGRRGWRKLHLGVDQSGVILFHMLTEATGDDATTALDLLTAVDGPLVRVTADAAYDTVAVYETATARGATVIIPPAKTANISGHGPRSPARDRTITWVKQLGQRRWKKVSGYHRQSRPRTRSSATSPSSAMVFAPGGCAVRVVGSVDGHSQDCGRRRRDDAPAQDHAGYRGEGAHHGDEHAEADHRARPARPARSPSRPHRSRPAHALRRTPTGPHRYAHCVRQTHPPGARPPLDGSHRGNGDTRPAPRAPHDRDITDPP